MPTESLFCDVGGPLAAPNNRAYIINPEDFEWHPLQANNQSELVAWKDGFVGAQFISKTGQATNIQTPFGQGSLSDTKWLSEDFIFGRGTNGSSILYSSDGVTFSHAGAPVSFPLRGVAGTYGGYIVLGADVLNVSGTIGEGESWVQIFNRAPYEWPRYVAVAYGNGTYVVAGESDSDGGLLITSTDSLTSFTRHIVPELSNLACRTDGLRFIHDRFFMRTSYYDGWEYLNHHTILYSIDGITWTEMGREGVEQDTRDWGWPTYDERQGLWFTVRREWSHPRKAQILTSTDLQTWSVESELEAGISSGGSPIWPGLDVAINEGVYAIKGWTGNFGRQLFLRSGALYSQSAWVDIPEASHKGIVPAGRLIASVAVWGDAEIISLAPSALAIVPIDIEHISASAVAPEPSTWLHVSTAAWMQVPVPISDVSSAYAFNDWTPTLDPVTTQIYYACDIVAPGMEPLRVPISSWQATLQLGRASYLSAVIPNADQYLAGIAERSHGEFVISRGARLSDGTESEVEMARAPQQVPTYSKGPTNHTLTMSGYFHMSEPLPQTRTLQNVRSVTVQPARRVRCDVDWFLRPGHQAQADGATFSADYLNIYVNDTDEYMDVGERGGG